MKKSLIATVMAVFITNSVQAQEDDETNHGGFIIGPEIGITDDGNFFYGGFAGYRHQFSGGLVLGFEGAYGDVSDTDSRVLDFRGGVVAVSASINEIWSINGILGQAFGNHLLSVKGGFSRLSSSVQSTLVVPDPFTGGPVLVPEAESNLDGFRLGVNYEYAVSRNVGLRVGADYYDYELGLDSSVFSAGVVLKF